ncbi:MAG: hypothetical protein V1882_01530 [Candidatus Omnitrophota bacterium]
MRNVSLVVILSAIILSGAVVCVPTAVAGDSSVFQVASAAESPKARLSSHVGMRRSSAADDLMGWIMIKGNTVSVYYLPGANLKKIESRLRDRSLPLARQYRDLFTNKAYSIESRISARLQFLLMRVQDILGMKPLIPFIDLKIFHTRDELQERYRQLAMGTADHKAFYVHALSTIFSSEKDIIDSIIAHEMAHATMDYYFMAPPPTQVAELLAHHVDEHLEGD